MANRCELCERPAARYTWKGHALCSGCQNVASKISRNRDVAERLYAMVHGVELREMVAKSMAADVEERWCQDQMDQIGVALGCGSAADVLSAVRGLVQRCNELAAGDSGAAAQACDPDRCEELRDALRCVLDVANALHGAIDAPERPGELAAAVARLVAENEGLRTERDALVAERGDLMRVVEHLQDEMADLRNGPDRYQVPDGYESLMAVFVAAMRQAAEGKGRARHATDEPFDRQPTCRDARECGIGFPIGQGLKKARESLRLTGGHQVAEILGSIVYLAIAVIVLMERPGEQPGDDAELAVGFAEGHGHD